MPDEKSQPVSVVTGGAGFLGSHLTDRLLAEGHRVIAIDNLITGHTDNIAHLSGNENYRFIRHNVSNYIFVPEKQIDYVFHFASPASPIDYLELPIPTLKVGALGTHNTLGLAKDKKATFILASTSECYGDPLVHPQKEDYWGNVNPIGPRGVYDEAKRFAEAMTMAYHRYHGVDTKIVRIFNTYGPRMRLRDGRVVPAFIGQALSGTPLTIFGDGSQTRSFCYVSDLIDGIFRLRHERFPRAGQYRQPARDDDQTIRGRNYPHHRNEIEDRAQTVTGRRSESAPARHHAREKDSRVGTEGRFRRRHPQNDRLFSGTIGAGWGNAGSLEISVVRLKQTRQRPLVIPSEVEESLIIEKAVGMKRNVSTSLDKTGESRVADVETTQMVCPVCGAKCVQEKCKIVCVSDTCVHRVVMNCSEF